MARSGRLATSRRQTKPRSGDRSKLSDNFLKLRAVLALISAPWGAKKKTVADLSREFERRRVKFSARTLYGWRERYLYFGLAGLDRRRRSDSGIARQRFSLRREAISA